MQSKNKIFIILVTIFVAICLWLFFSWYRFLNSPLIGANQPSINFVFTQGMSVKKAAIILKQQKLIKRTMFFVLLTRLKGTERNLKAGEYLIEPGVTTPSQLLMKMMDGDVIRHAFTIVEGWTFSQMIDALNNNPYIKHTIQELNPDEIMVKINHPGELPEGRFAADTYLFSGEVKDINILINAYKLMEQRLQMAWNKRDPNVPYHCSYEALIVASLIEKETAVEREKPIIAGVILRRLAKNRLLQIDASVIFGMGKKYNNKSNKIDYITDTPYNTYKRKGLPPTPIAIPSDTSIEAALHPVEGNTLYYVAKGDGTHEFSNTFKEHKAIRKSLRK